MVPPALVVRPKTKAMGELVAKLERGAKGNIVVEMGIALYRLAGYLERSDFNDLDQLAVRIEQRQLSAARSEERRGGKESGSPGGSRWATDNEKKKIKKK